MTPRIETEALQASYDQQSAEARRDWALNCPPRIWLQRDTYSPWFIRPVQPATEYVRANLVADRDLAIAHMGDLIAHFAAQAATAEHWRQVSVDSLVVVTGLRTELKGTKLALEQARASNREREADFAAVRAELKHLRTYVEGRNYEC